MENLEHFAILMHGVQTWNNWRNENPQIKIDLSGASLSLSNLSGANFSGTILERTDLSQCNLVGASFERALLIRTNLSEANLTGANLVAAILDRVDLTGAILLGGDISGATIDRLRLGTIDLSQVKGLETVSHRRASTVGIDTLYKSKGQIPESFLRGCGVPDTFITFSRSLVNEAIDLYSCFISYSDRDRNFAERLYADLQSSGIRCWFAPEDLMIGDKFRTRIDESIRLHDKLLLILSESSIASDWVRTEVEAALEQERIQKRTILFPIRIDDKVMNANSGWLVDILRTRHIGDFREWKDHNSYRKATSRLIRDLALTTAAESSNQERAE